ncbi:unnamed protein product [Rotaria socialis]|uniref:HMG box domain-containing protein n=1 Tax=Rotaria socialis TaxID=392032 RepID=A0A817Q020_9BILA|nr:unnamed protein product [Rotaria socialis]CAF3301994.1 unnamed protein product [Rotaria socialis]CAF3570385.1 unnamed protein product [Rotaria socialis]CAF4099868.1 unnamed protein product [Rotaria socialis]CAF4249394.1 unnamed protein product [Rotaria socialis]
MTSALYYQSLTVPQQQQQQQQPQIPMYYHPQQHQPQLLQQQVLPQQIHHMMPSSHAQNREQHHQPKELHKPKGRMSAYTFFVQKCRDEHRKAYPNENANFSEFSKKCAEKWKTMTESEKAKFAAQAEIDKQRFDREMAIYQPGEKRTKKKKKDPLAPKRPLSAFFHYCKEERPKLKAINPSLSVGEIAKELGDRWNHTAPDGKLTYEESAQRDKERYEKEMNEFKLANKKALKSNASPQTIPPPPPPPPLQHQSEQQVRIHQDQQQQQQQQQQYSSPSYQLPSFNPMQSFQPQTFGQMNNFQDNGLTSSLFPHYNGYSLQMPHNNVQMQQFQVLQQQHQQQQQQQHMQHQTYQTLTSVNTNHHEQRHDDQDNGDDNDTESDDEE